MEDKVDKADESIKVPVAAEFAPCLPEHGEGSLLVGGVDLVLLPQPDRLHPPVPAAAHHPPKTTHSVQPRNLLDTRNL